MSEFSKVFARARRQGKKTFTFNGKVYSTQLKGSSSPRPTQRRQNSAANAARSGQGVLRRQTPTYVEDFDNFLNQFEQQQQAQKRSRKQLMLRGSGVRRNDRVTNKQAIIDHKVANNVTEPYVIIDKANNQMGVYSGDTLLESHPITTGSIPGDGRYQIPNGQPLQYWQMPRTTPAGIFTLHPRTTSPYYGEPMFDFLDNGRQTNVALHAPAGPDRVAALRDSSPANNRISFGCISPDLGIVNHLYNDKVLQQGDTAYVIPEMPGNYIARQGHHLMTVWGGNNPAQFTSPSGFVGPVTYNESW